MWWLPPLYSVGGLHGDDDAKAGPCPPTASALKLQQLLLLLLLQILLLLLLLAVYALSLLRVVGCPYVLGEGYSDEGGRGEVCFASRVRLSRSCHGSKRAPAACL